MIFISGFIIGFSIIVGLSYLGRSHFRKNVVKGNVVGVYFSGLGLANRTVHSRYDDTLILQNAGMDGFIEVSIDSIFMPDPKAPVNEPFAGSGPYETN
jgi:hypothetical protein